MKVTFLAGFLAINLMLSGHAFGLIITPIISESSQALSIDCDPKTETACLQMCNQVTHCEIAESICRNCAGTQNLKMKRILDSVGTSLVAIGDSKPIDDLIHVLKTGNFISLHDTTLYNYSSQYDGDQIRAQFKYLCPNLPESSGKTGILLISASEILGAICPDEKSNESALYSTNSRWHLY